jgi:endonuclease/exonuclease/phosphatase family metal-dependent hydrolase
MTKLRVLTWNIRHCLLDEGYVDIEPFIEEIKKHDADIILLQEVDRNATRSGKIDQFTKIKESLGFQYHSAWTTRTKLGSAGLYGLATYSKFPIYATHQHLLSDYHSEKCIAQESEIDVDTYPLSIVNVHMPYERHTGSRHTETAWNTLNEIRMQKDLIIGGDFNVTPYSVEIDVLLSECMDVGESWTYVGGRIDYCMGRGRAVPVSQEVFRVPLSDHYPFVTEFLLKPFDGQVYKI